MSTVFLHVGQCGNQIGSAFWQRAAALPFENNPFFDDFGKARCIQVDAEPKVVAATLAANRASASALQPERIQRDGAAAAAVGPSVDDRQYGIFRQANVCFEQSGRGNNWALGYFGRHGTEGADESLSARVLDALEREIERCDAFSGCALLHSTTGGTGSGLGSRLLEQLCDRHARQFRVTHSTLPSLRAGDSCLQSYNSVLTLARLQACADAVIYQDNDAVWAQGAGRQQSGVAARMDAPVLYERGVAPPPAASAASTVTRATAASTAAAVASNGIGAGAGAGTGANSRIRLQDLNRDVAHALMEVFAPWSASSYQYRTTVGCTAVPLLVRPFQTYDLVAAVCPLPSTHFVEVYNARGLGVRAILDADGRADLGRQLVARVPALDLHAAPCRTLFHATIARGRVSVPSHSDACGGALSSASLQSDSTSTVAEAWHRRLARAFPLACPEFGQPTLVHAPSLDAASPAASAHLVPTASSSASSSTALSAPPTSLAVCLNRTRVASCMRHLLTRAQNLFNARAFLHWYTRHGCEESDFHDAFEVVQTVIDDYTIHMFDQHAGDP